MQQQVFASCSKQWWDTSQESHWKIKQLRTGEKNKQMAWDHTEKTEYMCKRLGNCTEWVMQVWPMNKMAQMEEKMYYARKDC